MCLNWENCNKVIKWGKPPANGQIDRSFMFMNRMAPYGAIAPGSNWPGDFLLAKIFSGVV